MQPIYCGLLFLNFFISIKSFRQNYDSNPKLVLNISRKNLKNIQSNIFSEVFSTVTSLHLQFNDIETISDSAFNNFPNVSYINLEGNNLIRRNLNFVSLPPNLTSLILTDAYKKNAEGCNDFIIDLFSPKLNILYLANNSIEKLIVKKFPATISTLGLSHNLLTEVPVLKNASSLTFLFLRNNKIELLKEDDFMDMPDLTFLSLTDNKIKEIRPYTFSNLKSLKFIYLERNCLKNIYYSAFYLQKNLVSLNLEMNEITFFDGKIVEINPNLVYLNLNQNFLKEIPVIRNASDLHVLLLSNNHISTLSAENLASIVNLKTLNLSNNSIADIPSGTFDGLEKLQALALNSNQLKNLPAEWTLSLKNLELLHLHDNRFEKFEDLSLDLSSSLQNAKVSFSLKNGESFYCYEKDINTNRTCNSVNKIQEDDSWLKLTNKNP